jgi:hypothetical protein
VAAKTRAFVDVVVEHFGAATTNKQTAVGGKRR